MNSAKSLLLIALGGACGASCRYLVALWLNTADSRLPLATLSVNVLGSFLAGCVVTLLLQRGLLASPVYGLVVVGFLGSFTTMSAFSIDTLRLLESGQVAHATIYVVLTLFACLLAVALGAGGVRLLT